MLKSNSQNIVFFDIGVLIFESVRDIELMIFRFKFWFFIKENGDFVIFDIILSYSKECKSLYLWCYKCRYNYLMLFDIDWSCKIQYIVDLVDVRLQFFYWYLFI